jgi:LacI family transcriptional regulator
MVSLKDIAAACGVSTATVSKALRDQNDISDETKDRIKQVADELGYFPNAAARALKTNRSQNLGVLYEDEAGLGLKHEYFSGVLQGFKKQSELLGYDITFINTNKIGRKMSYREHCRYRNFDGVVIVCANYEDPEVIDLMNSSLPVVTIDYIHHNCTAVSSNNVQGITDLLHYIIGLGHRRIAYIHGQDHSYVTRERLTAFYRVMEESGIRTPDEYVRSARYLEPEVVEQYTRELLELKEPPTCILYPDDTALIGGMNAVNALELKIPDDISIAGYDGTRFSQLLYPRLTTIRQDTDQIGREAAERLVGIIERPKTTLVERVAVEGILLKGQSVGRITI